MSRVERELKQALDASADSDLLQVVLRFDLPAAASQAAATLVDRRKQAAAAVSQQIHEVLERTVRSAGTEPVEVSLFPAIGSAYVMAPSSFLRKLLDQKEVLGATLNDPAKK